MPAARPKELARSLLRISSFGLAIVASIAVPLAVAEGIARLVGWRTEPASGALFRSLGSGQYYALDPGSRQLTTFSKHEIRANNLGVRGRDVGTKVPGEKRIVVLGDSVAFGYELPEAESFPALLDQRYSSSRPKADVVNASIAAWSRKQERFFLERYGAQLEPDLILVTVIHNDLRELQVSDAELRVGVRLGSVLSWLGARSVLFGEIKRRMRSWATDPARLATVEARMENPTSPQVLEGLDLEYAELDRIRELAQEQGARVGLVLLPYAFQLSKPGSEVLQEAHLDYARKHGLPVLDLLPVLRAQERRDLYMKGYSEQLPDEVHFNADGHRIIAHAIAEWIEAERLLDSAPPRNDLRR